MAYDQASHEHNTACMPVWHDLLNRAHAKAAFVVGMDKEGKLILLSHNTLPKDAVIESLKNLLTAYDNGQIIVQR